MNYRTVANYLQHKSIGEVNLKPSQTIQGEAYTIAELMVKFSTGQKLPVEKQGQYMDNPTFDDIDVEKVSKSDIFERSQIMIENKQKILERRQKHEQQRAQRVAERAISERRQRASEEGSNTADAMGEVGNQRQTNEGGSEAKRSATTKRGGDV